MKYPFAIQIAVTALLVPGVLAAEEEAGFTSRFSLSPRVGFNISAQFEGAGTVGSGSGLRTTPDGDTYNYDDGYMLTDISGNAGGQTWYWGYDNSAAQISGNSILLSRSSSEDATTSLQQDADPSIGAELMYQFQIGSHGRFHHGIEAGAAYQNIDVSASGNSMATLTTVTDTYGFTPGGTPPGATPSSPYQGTYQGPGFLINDTPSGSSTVIIPNVPLATQNELHSSLWGFRVGPYVDYAVADKISLGLSVGVAAGVLNADLEWSDTAGTASASGSGSDLGVLMGFYAGGTASWQFAERWDLVAGFQYQNLGTYENDFDGRTLQLDFSNALFASLGVGWSF